MRWKTRWIPLAVLLLVGCDNSVIGPEDSAPAATVARTDQVLSPALNWQHPSDPRWLQLRPDGLYDDRGNRRLSPQRVHQLGIDEAFELHRQAKLQWLKERQKKLSFIATSTAITYRRIPNPSETRNLTTVSGSPSRLTAPVSPRLAVASDDPCFFDATIWCTNEYGGELGGGAGGGGGSGDPTSAPSDDGTLNCSFIVSSMNHAYAAYMQAQATYLEMAGSVTDAPFSNGVLEAALQAQYSKMQSYLADYYTWKNLAVKYKCL